MRSDQVHILGEERIHFLERNWIFRDLAFYQKGVSSEFRCGLTDGLNEVILAN